jgi:hypothetical protein
MRAVNRADLIRLRRGAYLPMDDLQAVEERDRAAFLLGRNGVAAALRIPIAVVIHRSAAALHQLPLLLPETATPCITLPPGFLTRPAALHTHRQPITHAELCRSSDVAVTNPTRTCIDLTREDGLQAGLVATDAAIRMGLTSIAELECAYSRLRGRAGLADGRDLLDLASPLSESPLESISRLAMRVLPVKPELQVSLYDLDGFFLGRSDFYWREAGLVGEADGRAKYSADEAYREKRRHDRITAAGLLVTRWDWATAMQPRKLCAQITRELARAVRLREAGYPAAVRALRPVP